MMYGVMHKYENQYIRCRDGIYYFVRRVPCDLRDIYTSDRISMSLKTKLITTARRFAKSIDQRLEDYWMGIRLQKLDIPAIQLVQPDRLASDNSLRYSNDCNVNSGAFICFYLRSLFIIFYRSLANEHFSTH